MRQAVAAPRGNAQTPAPVAQSQVEVPQAVVGSATPHDLYMAARAHRRAVLARIEDLSDQREGLVRQVRQGPVSDADRAGIDGRLAQVDQQLASAYNDLAVAEAGVARTAAIPGAAVDPPEPNPWQYGPPEEVVMMGIFFSAVLAFPLVIAWARRIWRRSAKVEVTLPPQLVDRMESLERSMDAVAIEVERIGEGQRFVTQLLADRAKAAALPDSTRVPR